MRFRFLFYFSLLLALSGVGYYFLVSSSYQNSVKAKMHYMLGEYKLAYKLAKQAHEQDRYNRMAATVMAHSTLALEYIDFIDTAKEYKRKITMITKKAHIERPDRLRMKFMAEIIMERYPKLTRSGLIDQSLMDEAKSIYETFKQVHENVIKSL
ncbi:MAG: hypothetical protein OEW60_08210 [Thiovulaceae bacterium]|nr:hypothetical protein [Sulfurimonadaceae bacterium]